MSILVTLHPHQHLVWSLFLILVIVVGEYIAVFHCGFYFSFSHEYWLASLLCLLAICISLVKCPSSKSFSFFKFNFLIVWFFSSPLSDMWFAESFFQSVACLFLPSQLCLLKYRSFKFWLSAKYQYFLLWVSVLALFIRTLCQTRITKIFSYVFFYKLYILPLDLCYTF